MRVSHDVNVQRDTSSEDRGWTADAEQEGPRCVSEQVTEEHSEGKTAADSDLLVRRFNRVEAVRQNSRESRLMPDSNNIVRAIKNRRIKQHPQAFLTCPTGKTERMQAETSDGVLYSLVSAFS